MNVHLRLDAVNEAHITQTVFIDGAKSGHLIMTPPEYNIFGTALILAAKQMPQRLTITIDPIGITPNGRYTMPASPDCETVQE